MGKLEDHGVSQYEMAEKDGATVSPSTAVEDEHEMTVKYVLLHHKRLVWWAFFWAMCAVGWGFDAQVNGAMVSVPAFRRDFGYVFKGEYVIPANWLTAFGVISSPGQFGGGFLCSYMADRLGRKWALVAGLILCTGGIIGEMSSTTRGAFLASKLILGFGLGFYLTLGPIMTSELSPVVLRGIATAGVNLGIGIGQLSSNGAIAGFGIRSDRWSYRGPFAVQLLFVAFLAVGLPFAPERAKWAQSAITVIWAFVYSLTIGAIAFAILGETSSATLRAHTAALATATQSVMGVIMNFAIPYMINPDAGDLKGKVGFIFGGLGALGAAWAWFYIPELKGRTLDEIDALFHARVPPRKMGSHVLVTSSDELSG